MYEILFIANNKSFHYKLRGIIIIVIILKYCFKNIIVISMESECLFAFECSFLANNNI